MENTTIVNYSELTARLTVLKSVREEQEIVLKNNFSELVSSINIFSFFKNPSASTNLQSNDLVKSGLNMAIDLIAGLVLGKNRNIKGFLSTLMVKRITRKIIDNNFMNVISKIGTMIFSKKSEL